MYCSGEGGSVGKIKRIKLIDARFKGNTGHGDIYYLVHLSGAYCLNAEQTSGILVGCQLYDEHGRVGIVMSLVVGDADGGHGVIALKLCFALGKTGSAAVEMGQYLCHTCSEASAVAVASAGNVAGEQARGYVGGGAHCRPLGFAGNEISHLGAVSGGVYVGDVCLHIFISHDSSAVHLNARTLKERSGGADADSHYNDICGQASGVCNHSFRFSVSLYRAEACPGKNAYAFLLELSLYIVSHFGVEGGGHDGFGGVDHRHRQTERAEVFSHFKSDKSGSAYHGAAASGAFYVLFYVLGIIRCADGKNSGQINSVRAGNKRGGSYGDYQLVIALASGLTGLHTPAYALG